MNDKVNYRTCVCCKKKMLKTEMVRIATLNGKVYCDKTFKFGGRGMYICSTECLDKLSTSKKFLKFYNVISNENIFNEIKEVLDVEK